MKDGRLRYQIRHRCVTQELLREGIVADMFAERIAAVSDASVPGFIELAFREAVLAAACHGPIRDLEIDLYITTSTTEPVLQGEIRTLAGLIPSAGNCLPETVNVRVSSALKYDMVRIRARSSGSGKPIIPGMSVLQIGSAGAGGAYALYRSAAPLFAARFNTAFSERAEALFAETDILPAIEAARRFEYPVISVGASGIFGLLFDLRRDGVFIEARLADIPVSPIVTEITEAFQANPYFLHGAGAALVFCENPEEAVARFREEGYRPVKIGNVTENTARILTSVGERSLEPAYEYELTDALRRGIAF